MKLIGTIKSYNGKYGMIETEDKQIIDFDIKDISFGQDVHIGDRVEFRLEVRNANIKLARNIGLVSNNQIDLK